LISGFWKEFSFYFRKFSQSGHFWSAYFRNASDRHQSDSNSVQSQAEILRWRHLESQKDAGHEPGSNDQPANAAAASTSYQHAKHANPTRAASFQPCQPELAAAARNYSKCKLGLVHSV
jgi:hypothetical protein